MTSGGWKRRGALIAGGIAVIVVLVGLLRPQAERPREQPVAAAPEQPQAAARARREFPSHSAEPETTPAEAPAPAVPTAFAVRPPSPTEIRVGDDRLPASPRSGAGWATEFRDAVCACSTRACVRDLQAGFIHKLNAVNYDEDRDGTKYSEAARAAVRCFTALPEDT